jgi:hypothetical protein
MSDRKLCGARLDRSDAAFGRVLDRAAARKQDPEAAILARLRHRGFCTRPALPGSARCQRHGGHSTGPADGGAGRRRMVDEMRDAIARGELARVPWGRKPGGKNRPKAVIEEEKHRKATARALRRIQHQARLDKRARKQADRQQRDEAAVLVRRHERFQARDRDWYDTDLLDVALEAIHAHGATKRDIAELKRAERIFIERLRDNRDPPEPEVVERAYAKLTRIETALGGEGKDARLAKLQDAYEDWQKRRTVDAAIAELAATPGKPEPMSARDVAELVKRAGQIAGSRLAGVPYEVDFEGRRVPTGPHSIAPWLRRS